MRRGRRARFRAGTSRLAASAEASSAVPGVFATLRPSVSVKRKKAPSADEIKAAMRPTSAALAAAARTLGALGGLTAAKNMTASARRDRAKRAARDRWSKRPKEVALPSARRSAPGTCCSPVSGPHSAR